MKKVPESTVGRLSLYLRLLRDQSGRGVSTLSSEELAEQAGMTLAGFVRDPGFNVYAGGARIAPRLPQGVGG